MEEDPEPVSRQAKLDALRDVARYRPRVTLGIVALYQAVRILLTLGAGVVGHRTP